MVFTPNDNAVLVATADGQTPLPDYRSELEQIQRDREIASMERFMRSNRMAGV